MCNTLKLVSSTDPIRIILVGHFGIIDLALAAEQTIGKDLWMGWYLKIYSTRRNPYLTLLEDKELVAR